MSHSRKLVCFVSSHSANEKLHYENCGRMWSLCYFLQNSVLQFREESCLFPILLFYRILFQSKRYFCQYWFLCSSVLSSSLDKTTKANSMKQNLVNLFCIVQWKYLQENPRTLNLDISENVVVDLSLPLIFLLRRWKVKCSAKYWFLVRYVTKLKKWEQICGRNGCGCTEFSQTGSQMSDEPFCIIGPSCILSSAC